MKLKNLNFKKITLVLVIVLLSSYVLWDISGRLANTFRMQGYQAAVNEMIEQADNEECEPFNIFSDDKEVDLVNVECLEQESSESMDMTSQEDSEDEVDE